MHRVIARALVTAILLAGGSGAAVAAGFPPFERTTLADGVSHLTVYALHADRTGFLWFGTMYGLVRYDGSSFRTFRHDPFDSTSLSYDDVVTIGEADDGNLWIGTWGGGASRYDRRAGRFVRYLPGGADSTSVSDGVVWAVAPTTDGGAWLGTGQGLDRVGPDGIRVQHFRTGDDEPIGLGTSPIRALCLDHTGTLWAATFGTGLAARNADGAWTLFVPEASDSTSLPSTKVVTLLEDSAGRLWVGTFDAGLAVRLPGESGFHPVLRANGWSGDPTSLSVQGLAEGPDGAIWVATAGGLDRVDPVTREVHGFPPDLEDPGALPAGNVTAVAVDRSGCVWASSYQTGVVRLPPHGPAFRTRLPDDADPTRAAARNVVAFTETRDGTLWIATSAGLVAQPHDGGPTRRWAPQRGVDGALPARPRALAEGPDGALWVGTFAGVRRWSAARNRFDRPLRGRPAPDTAPINELLVAHDGTLWVGAEGFLFRAGADGDSGRFDPDPSNPAALPEGAILALGEDSRDRLWVGTYRGLARLDPGAEGFVRLRHDPRDPSSLGSDYVYAIHEAADGTLWFGTAGGLDRYDEATATFAHFREREGLPNVVVGSVEEDADGRLWLGTQRGLARFDPHVGRAVAFDVADGLQGSLYHPHASGHRRDGTLLFGGPGGYNAFRPDDLPPPDAPPPVVLTDFRALGRPSTAGFDASRLAELRLGPRENFFAFDFAPLDFLRGARVPVEYRLVGLDTDWIRAGAARTAAYTSVPSGRYVFEVRAAADHGAPGPVLSLPLTIRPPFWRTAAFLAAALALTLAVAFGAHRSAVHLRVQQAVAVARAREEEREAVRHAAAADFHDELGHRVARIGLFAEVLSRGGVSDAESASTLQRIAAEARRLADESRDFFWALGAERGTAADVLTRLERFGSELFERTGVDFHAEGPDEALAAVELPAEARRNLLSLFKEAMTNALRHAGCREVVLLAAIDGDTLAFTLEDDGRGFLRPAVMAGHGLKNMELRARRVDGTLTIASEPDAGTRVAITRRVVRTEPGSLLERSPAHPDRDRRG